MLALGDRVKLCLCNSFGLFLETKQINQLHYSSVTAKAGIGYHFGVPRNILPVVK